MPTEDGKKNVTMRAATLIVCCVCVVGLSVLAAYLVARSEYKEQLAGMDRRIGEMRISQEALAGRNIQLLHSLRKMEHEYGELYTAKAEAGGPALKQEHKASAQEHKAQGKKKSPVGTVLGPTWVGAGKASTLFGGDLRIVLKQPRRRTCAEKARS